MKQIAWKNGEKNRPLKVRRLCECSTCHAADVEIGTADCAGFLSGSDATGRGFTIYIQDNSVYAVLRALVGEQRSMIRDDGLGDATGEDKPDGE